MNLVEELRSKKSRDNRDLLDRAADRIEELELLLINENKSNGKRGQYIRWVIIAPSVTIRKLIKARFVVCAERK